MSLASTSSPALPSPPSRHPCDSSAPTSVIAGWLVIAGLLAWLYARTLVGLVGIWSFDPNYSHGFAVPLVSGLFAYAHIRYSTAFGVGQVGLGAMSILAGCLVHLAAEVGAWPLLDFLALGLTLRGIAVAVGGREWAAGFTFPILFLFFMFPLPVTWTQSAALWLQDLVSQISAGILDLFTTCYRRGVNLHIPGVSEPIRVAEECSGLRQIVAFVALAAALSYWFRKPVLYQLTIILAAVPVAILANVLRVLVMAAGLRFFGRGGFVSWLHDAAPLFTMPVGLAVLGLVAWGLARIWPAPAAEAKP